MAESDPVFRDRLAGLLLGTAVGDALGLPAEGLSPRRRRRLMPGPWQHRFIFGRGMVSDDTEHTLLVAQSLLEQPDDIASFQRRLAWGLRWWFASLPAGIGRATALSCLKLWLGFPPARSGVFSAGNGPAMRSAIIGAYFHDRPEAIERFIRASTELTHTDPKAAVGTLAVARIAAFAIMDCPEQAPDMVAVTSILSTVAPNDAEWQRSIDRFCAALLAGATVPDFAASLNLSRGVTGYTFHTVPVAIYAWIRHYGDFRATLEAALDCGGDTDSVGAIAGGLAGATVGEHGVPLEWARGVVDWPRSVRLLRRIAHRLADQLQAGSPQGKVNYFWPAVLPRNLLFLTIVLIHGLRRLAPPF
jgi:ADP-ribosyl-[dinitrogen reductase] hydrolase